MGRYRTGAVATAFERDRDQDKVKSMGWYAMRKGACPAPQSALRADCLAARLDAIV